MNSPVHQNAHALMKRRWMLLCALVVLLLVSLVLDLWAGPADIGLLELINGLFNPERLEPRHQIILFDVRLPDALIALAVGAALGLSGIETQTILNQRFF